MAVGIDTLHGGDGFDTLRGGMGDDILRGNDADTLLGGSGNDYLFCDGAASGLLKGGKDADTISLAGDAYGNSIFGGGGDDLIQFGVTGGESSTIWDNTINGGAGSDTIEFFNKHFYPATATKATIFYGSGDVIRFESAYERHHGQIYVATSLTHDSDHISVYSDGTDTYFQLSTYHGELRQSTYKVAGADLVITTAVGLVNLSTANFGFAMASSSSDGITIQLA